MDNNMIKGSIKGMELMGATFVKCDGFHLFFNIIKGSDIDDGVKLKRAKDTIFKTTGLGLKIRKV